MYFARFITYVVFIENSFLIGFQIFTLPYTVWSRIGIEYEKRVVLFPLFFINISKTAGTILIKKKIIIMKLWRFGL